LNSSHAIACSGGYAYASGPFAVSTDSSADAQVTVIDGDASSFS